MITASEAIEDIEKALESGVPDGLKKETLILQIWHSKSKFRQTL